MNKILVLLFLLLLTGCSIFTKVEYVEVPIYTQVECIPISDSEPLEMYPIIWQIATNTEAHKVLALDGPNYKNLNINLNRITTYIEAERLLKEYYKECITRHNKKGQP